ncbi:hypothetical protein SDC9_189160 [bioreactor metagenome]|uniref:Uncharacterized protein n=1 Tax=bioreactor metagenome TaxID=1076179 RepID=A0A645HSP7_9ZZZZ
MDSEVFSGELITRETDATETPESLAISRIPTVFLFMCSSPKSYPFHGGRIKSIIRAWAVESKAVSLKRSKLRHFLKKYSTFSGNDVVHGEKTC